MVQRAILFRYINRKEVKCTAAIPEWVSFSFPCQNPESTKCVFQPQKFVKIIHCHYYHMKNRPVENIQLYMYVAITIKTLVITTHSRPYFLW